MRRILIFLGLIVIVLISTNPLLSQTDLQSRIPENVYRGELLTYPGPWGFQIPRSGIILVRDDELVTLAADPDKPLNLSLDRTPRYESLRQICERAQARGERTLILAFDHFFKQYRRGQDTPRRLMPDTDEYIAKVAAISRFAAGYGLGLELSMLTPLELGKGYTVRTGESGLWMHYREGLRDPRTGAFSVQLWQHQQWVNNKGVFTLEDAGVRAFAFRETPRAGHLLSRRRSRGHRRDQARHRGRAFRKHHGALGRFPRGAHPRARCRFGRTRWAGPRSGGANVSLAGDGLLQPQGAAVSYQPRRSTSPPRVSA